MGCRRSGPKGTLLRIVRTSTGTVEADPGGRKPGRGAYLHPASECIEAGFRRGQVARALRVSLGPSEAARLMEVVSRMVGEGA